MRKQPRPRGKPTARKIRRANRCRAKVRVVFEHVFAALKARLGFASRTVGEAREKAKLGLANLVTNVLRLTSFETRAALA